MVWSCRLLDGLRANGIRDITLVSSSDVFDLLYAKYPEFRHVRFEMTSQRTLWAKVMCWRNISKRYHPDMLLSPDLYSWLSLFSTKVPKVIVCHDLKWIRTDKRRVALWLRVIFGIAMLRCRKVIAISKFVKGDILRHFSFIQESRVAVVYNSIALSEAKQETRRWNKDYLLYVSTLHEYKNVLTLVKAFKSIHDEIRQDLLIIGNPTPYWKDVVMPYIREHKLEKRIVHISGRVSDEQLVNLYRGASLFVHPSLFEGFGYTPIEAALCETPVLTNKETALYETTLGLLNYYEPATDYKVMAENIVKLLKNPPGKEALHAIATRYREEYDNAKQADKLYQLLSGLKAI